MYTNKSKPQPLIFWGLWFAILQGMIVLQFILVGGLPSGENAPNPPMLFYIVAILSITLSFINRFILMPKARSKQRLFVHMVIGVALIDLAHVFQLFLIGNDYPQMQFDILCLVAVAIISYTPLYAKKTFPQIEQ
ncbi:hypothetical protein MLD52_21350 [Puniceicoccaceae bacterium K14]|nr:hypothetical protein [Puniceicoccaceae bacterium K14]